MPHPLDTDLDALQDFLASLMGDHPQANVFYNAVRKLRLANDDLQKEVDLMVNELDDDAVEGDEDFEHEMLRLLVDRVGSERVQSTLEKIAESA